MHTVLDAGPDALTTVDTTDGVPVVEVACTACKFFVQMVAFAPITYAADVVGMATALADQHRTASHPELAR